MSGSRKLGSFPKMASTELSATWTPSREPSNISFVDSWEEMPSVVEAKQREWVKQAERLNKASGRDVSGTLGGPSAPQVARLHARWHPQDAAKQKKKKQRQRNQRRTPPWQGSAARSMRRSSSAPGGAASQSKPGTASSSGSGSGSGSASTTLPVVSHAGKKGANTAHFAVRSRVLGHWMQAQREDLADRARAAKHETSVRKQRTMLRELAQARATAADRPPAAAPPISHSTLLFWARHPDLTPLRFDAFDPMAPTVALEPTEPLTMPEEDSKARKRRLKRQRQRHAEAVAAAEAEAEQQRQHAQRAGAGVGAGATATTTRAEAEAAAARLEFSKFEQPQRAADMGLSAKVEPPSAAQLTATLRSGMGVTAAKRRVAPPLPPAKVPPMLYAALEHYLDVQVGAAGL